MIQFNLLPDVKIEYLKAQRTRKIITVVAFAVTAASLVFLVLIFSINVYKTKNLASLTESIAAASKKLTSQADLDRKLTVQNQLSSITQLHNGKPDVARLFTFLNQTTPIDVVSLTNFKVDFLTTTVTITGTSDSLVSVNKFVDTLKFTKFQVETVDPKTEKKLLSDPAPAFISVVLDKFTYTTPEAREGQQADQPTTYIIDLTYDPALFDITKIVTLLVPTTTTTRSALPIDTTDLFRPEPVTNEQEGEF